VRRVRLLALFVVSLVVFAACGDDGGDGNGSGNGNNGNQKQSSGGDDPDCVVSASDVEDAFGGSAELLNAPVEGLCTVSVEDSDLDGDGTIEIVFLHGPGGDADEQAEFDVTCQTNQAEPLDDVGDAACYSEEFNTATLLLGDQIIEVRAYSFFNGEEADVRASVIELAGAVAQQA
jgi:hypothetical protein